MDKLFFTAALCLAVACGIASAQPTVATDDEKQGEATKTADPIVISEDRQIANWDVTGQSVVIDASKSTISLKGNCRNLTVNGSDNNIRSCKLESITVTGNNNLVTYPSSPKAKVSDKGSGNSLVAR